jgi:chromosome segregation and condensation protein ScpB
MTRKPKQKEKPVKQEPISLRELVGILELSDLHPSHVLSLVEIDLVEDEQARIMIKHYQGQFKAIMRYLSITDRYNNG